MTTLGNNIGGRVRIGWTTLPTHEGACEFARAMVEAGLVACAQVSGPIASFYRWEDRLCHEDEWRVTLKFASGKAELVTTWLKAHHPYTVPQWIAVDAAQASMEYLAWVMET
jgi:periplasmic divalent cation tolerance protein